MKSVAALIFQQKFDSLRPSVIRSHLKILGLVFCFWDLILLEVAVLPQQKGTDLTWEVEMNRWKTGEMLTESFFSYSFYEMAGNVLRTGTGGVARFFLLFLIFHYLCTGKIPHSFWGATGAGSSQKVHLQQWQLSVGFTWITSNLDASYPCQHSTLSNPRRLSTTCWDASLDLSCCSELLIQP